MWEFMSSNLYKKSEYTMEDIFDVLHHTPPSTMQE